MIRILQYGSGNVRAILNIYEQLNIPCGLAHCADQLDDASALILPGVGAFDSTMALLAESKMLDRLNKLVLVERVPVLGVCVGMQIMAFESDEGRMAGLGWIRGRVVRINTCHLSSKPNLPHMGWNSIESNRESAIFRNVDMTKGFYFLHSYCIDCESQDSVLATTWYGQPITAAVAEGHIYGFQFHPEKSHHNGINLFRNFAKLNREP